MSMHQLLDRAAELLDTENNIAFCIITTSTGSSPASAGALMLVDASGAAYGTIGGGCVEADVRRAAVERIHQGTGSVQKIALDHDFAWEEGLICGGTIEVVISMPPSPASLRCIASDCRNRVHTALTRETPEGSWTLDLPPRPHVIIVGAGHLGQEVCRYAISLDFSVSVFDDREDMLQRFIPEKVRHVHGNVATTLATEPLDEETYVVIVTRGHRDDAVALHAVASRGAGYVGMVGSKRKIGLTLNELRRRGVSQEDLASIHAPIGLDIGAKTVGEIALAIAAQLVATRRSRTPDLTPVTGPVR